MPRGASILQSILAHNTATILCTDQNTTKTEYPTPPSYHCRREGGGGTLLPWQKFCWKGTCIPLLFYLSRSLPYITPLFFYVKKGGTSFLHTLLSTVPPYSPSNQVYNSSSSFLSDSPPLGAPCRACGRLQGGRNGFRGNFPRLHVPTDKPYASLAGGAHTDTHTYAHACFLKVVAWPLVF
jgi:hypothetical protein